MSPKAAAGGCIRVNVFFPFGCRRRSGGELAALAACAVLVCASTQAKAQSVAPTPASAGAISARWTPKHLDFFYQTGFMTRYSCDGLRDKMRRLLLKLGARDDIDLRALGCTRIAGPDDYPGVYIRMNVLHPDSGQGGETVPAHWQRVDLLAGRDAFDAARDCELIEQVRQKVLPLFATRNVDYSARCEKRQAMLGGTRLSADVLLPVTHSSAAR